jgi:hypothetical protein
MLQSDCYNTCTNNIRQYMNSMAQAFSKVNIHSTVTCAYCNQSAEFVLGNKIYPHRPDLFTKGFYRCAPCAAYVGCHPNTSTPMGRLANEKLRNFKSITHRAFDQIWKTGQFTRAAAYVWLSTEMQLTKDQCHIGEFDQDQCLLAIELCNDKLDLIACKTLDEA